MNDEERDATLLEIQLKVAKMATDFCWFKRIITAAAILVCACLGVQLPGIFIHG